MRQDDSAGAAKRPRLRRLPEPKAATAAPSPRMLGIDLGISHAARLKAAARGARKGGAPDVAAAVDGYIRRHPEVRRELARALADSGVDQTAEALAGAEAGFRGFADAVLRAELRLISQAAVRKMVQLARDTDMGMTQVSLKVPTDTVQAFQGLAADVRERGGGLALMAFPEDAFEALDNPRRIMLALRMVPPDARETEMLRAILEHGEDGIEESDLNEIVGPHGKDGGVHGFLDRFVARRRPVMPESEGCDWCLLFRRRVVHGEAYVGSPDPVPHWTLEDGVAEALAEAGVEGLEGAL